MPFERPTLVTLVERCQADLNRELVGADARLRRTVEYVLSRVVAGASHGLHGHLAWVAQQLLPRTASPEFVLLWAEVFGVERGAPAAAAGTLLVLGNDDAVVPAGHVWRRNDGVAYVVDEDTTVVDGEALVPVTAQLVGSAGNADDETLVRAATALAGINSQASFATAATEGEDLESIESLRERLLLRLRTPPRGGGPGDYVYWFRQVPGFRQGRAWEKRHYNGLGTVGLFFVRPGNQDYIPSGGEVAVVQAALEARAPITAKVHVYAPIAVPRYFECSGPAGIRAGVEAELRALILREAEPGGTIPNSHVLGAVTPAAALVSPLTDLVDEPGRLSTFGGVSWV